jgi:hypothetical protein
MLDGNRIDIQPTSTVQTVIQAAISASEQKWTYLLFDGEPLSPTILFSTSGITDGALVQSAQYPDQIFIQNTGLVMTLGTGPWENIETIRLRIWQKYQFRIRPGWLTLPDRRWVSLEDTQTLSFYSIGHLSLLEFRPKQSGGYQAESPTLNPEP